MVRFNLINPKLLTDEHLRAEKPELLMLRHFILKHPEGYIPKEYTLNKGHMSFFRDKLDLVEARMRLIYYAVLQRSPNYNEYNNPISTDRRTPDYVAYNHLQGIYEGYLAKYNINNTHFSINIERIIDRLRNPKRKTNNWHYFGSKIEDIEHFIETIYKPNQNIYI